LAAADRLPAAPRASAVAVLSVAIGLLLAVVFASSSVAKKERPPSREEIATVWVGLSDDELYLLRLVLRPDGTGQAGCVFVDGNPQTAPITRWTYDPGAAPRVWEFTGGREPRLVITVGGGDFAFHHLAGTATGQDLLLEGTDPGWKHRVTLRSEQDLHAKWELLRRAMTEPAPGRH
jgi:hypothetical protein